MLQARPMYNIYDIANPFVLLLLANHMFDFFVTIGNPLT